MNLNITDWIHKTSDIRLMIHMLFCGNLSERFNELRTIIASQIQLYKVEFAAQATRPHII